ncbi:hypothetical protein CKO12_00585 [Chromatium okenii]|uniref:Lcl domain-containing protein n=1 Tax=Chromatium okenii TaxID=61644 RepID=UPI001905BF0C|nr:DUF1566 domain-containing protein [Chromatium okenii]MBK1640402.1 hypothetical protein [Chromatium okenii]
MFHFHSILLLTRWVLVVCFIGGLSFPAGAAIFTVNNIDDSSVGSLRDKITNASAGDTISFDPRLVGQTITLASQITINKFLTIDGSGASGLIIKGASGDRVFYVNEWMSLRIKFLTLESVGSRSIQGGVIYTKGNGVLELENCTIQNTTSNAGAIYNTSSDLYLSDCTLQYNTASFGAGVFNDSGTVRITNSTLKSNGSSAAGTGGGAIKNNAAGTVTIINSTLSGNQADIGGGIFNEGALSVENSTFSENKAINVSNQEGGAIYNESGATATVINSTFSANTAGWIGGAISNVGTLTIKNSTFAENVATSSTSSKGGGIYNGTGGNLTVANSIISGNSIYSTNISPEIHNSGIVTVQGKNVIGFNGGFGVDSITLNASTCFTPSSGAALTTLIGALQNNGGFTFTRAPVSGGLAHNTGDNALASGLSFDQRGFSRILDSTVDIGAVEIDSVSSVNLSVTTIGSGTVTSNVGGINCGTTCFTSINSGTVVTLTATPDSDGFFTNWTNCTVVGTNQCQVTMDAAKNVTATFDTSKTLTVNFTGTGTVVATYTGIGTPCTSNCVLTYLNNSAVALNAIPADGYIFSGWSGDCVGTSICSLTITDNKTVTANFTLNNYSITATSNLTAGGSISCSPNPVTSGGTANCTVTTNASYTFNGFSGDCSGTTCELTNVTADKTVTANFTLNTYSITATANPTEGGSVSCGSYLLTYGSSNTCMATANTGYTFNNFNSDSGCSNANDPICILNNVSTNKNVVANFIAIPIALTVTSAGTGVGTITSVPAGINCSTNCSANFASDSEIILNAAAATGSTFTGWSGGICSGTGACTLHLTAAQTVIATFRYSAGTLGLNDTGIDTCGNATANRLPCPVAGFPRQDAEYGTNQFDFTKLDLSGNELAATATNHACVRDNVTGLTWEIKTKDGGSRDHKSLYQWTERLAYVENVNAVRLCGFSDWRVPDIKELTGIVNYQHVIPKSAVVTSYFSDLDKIGTLGFWSEATSSDIASSAWFLYFSNGAANYGNHNKKYHLRLVRGAPARNVLVDNNNGTISQTNTGLIWAKCSEGQTGNTCAGTATVMTWEQALVTASNSNLANYSDWRLPNIKELQTLIEYERDGAAKLNSNYFPNTPATAIWSSTPFALYARNAWYLYPNGYLGSLARTTTFHARLVRNE